MKTNKTELIANNLISYIWLTLAVGCLIGVIFAGAWWHLFTAGICLMMYFAMKVEKGKKTENEEAIKQRRARELNSR